MKYIIGPILAELVKIILLLKKVYRMGDPIMKQNEIMLEFDIDSPVPEIEVNKWAYNAFSFIHKKRAVNESEVPFYLFRLLTIIYKTMTKEGTLKINDGIRLMIEDSIIEGLEM